MITHYFTLAALAAELHSALQEYAVEEVFSQQKNELIISLHHKELNPYSIIAGIEPKFNYLYYGKRFSRAKKNSADLFSNMIGQKIRSVTILPLERIIEISLTPDMTFSIHLYNTASSNCYLLDVNRHILESFKRDADLSNGILPVPQPRLDISVTTDDELFSATILTQGEKPLRQRLREVLPFLGTQYADEICIRAGIDGTRPAAAVGADGVQELRRQVRCILDEIQHPRPVIYPGGALTTFLAVMPLSSFGGRESRLLSSVNEGIQLIVGSTHRRKSFEEERDRIAGVLQREHSLAARAHKAATKEASAARKADEYELTGKLIMAHIHTLAKGMSKTELPDIFGDNELRTIPLDPRLTPAKNAEHFFQKARQSRAHGAETIRRLELLTARESQLTRMLDQIARVDSPQSLDEFRDQYGAELRALHLQPSGKPVERPPFRIFEVAGGLEVWVGKNSANNDLLTTKYATPHDLWFHVRGAGGSHTVLKVKGRESPPREAVRQAAAIAAYYSKMRNSGTVPVAYCERKYVRKPKGAASGSVALEREEILFVRPALP
jgi:predicted ribosome quality control (RQC) complex YloA/Tae2 family protein